MDVLLDALNGTPGQDAASGPAPGEAGGPAAEPAPRRRRMSFRQWRRTRPFWAGIWCLIGGGIIIYGPFTVIRLILVSGTAVWSGLLIGALICVMGLFLWFTPHLRQVVGVIAAMLGIASFITSNLGGFGFGMLFSLVGGAMGFAWTPLRVQPGGVAAAPSAPGGPGAAEGARAPGSPGGLAAQARPGAEPSGGQQPDTTPTREIPPQAPAGSTVGGRGTARPAVRGPARDPVAGARE